MTRRITFAILLAVWVTVIAGSLAAYLTTRSVLLDDLDASLIAQVSSLPEVASGLGAAPQAFDGDRFIVRNALGETLERSPAAPAIGLTRTVVKSSFARLADGRRVRTLTLRFSLPAGANKSPSPSVTVIYSGSADRLDLVLRRLSWGLVSFALIAGLMAAAAAFVIARAALRPLRHTAHVIGTINEYSLHRRIPERELPPELQDVAMTLNGLLARIEQAFSQRRQFLADASHELRTPVSALVTTIEVALRRPRGAPELTDALRVCHTEAQFLRRLVQALLEQVRGELLPQMSGRESIDVGAVCNECADVIEPLAAARGVQFTRHVQRGIRMTGEASRLRSIVLNLLSNAVEHSQPGASVELSCLAGEYSWELAVQDTGPGIAREHLEHVFEPFYRADAARGQEGQHLGLGLFLVRSHCHALRGEYHMESRIGAGTAIRIRFPAQSTASVPPASTAHAEAI